MWNHNFNLSELSDILKNNFPEIYRMFCGKLFKNTERFADHRRATLEMATLMQLLENTPLDQTPLFNNPTLESMVLVAGKLKEYRAPIYFIEEEFLNAVSRTDPRAEIDWKNMKLPFDAGIFILPKNTVRFADGSECGHIIWARINSGLHAVSRKNNIYSGNDFFMIIAISPSNYSLHYILTDSFDAASHDPRINNEGETFSIKTDKEEIMLTNLLLRITFNTLKIMTLKPELHQPGKRLKTNHKKGREIWQPAIIGANYKVRRTAAAASAGKGAATGFKQPLHWRCGHWRTQHFGEGNRDCKELWIEPYLVTGCGED